MAWTLTGEIADYQAAAGGLLTADPVRNTVLLTVLASLASLGPTAFGPEPPLFGWWVPGNSADPGITGGTRPVGAAVLQTPPHTLLITGLPGGSAEELARALANRGLRLPGVSGAEEYVTEFARAWQQLTGVPGRVSQRQRLYRLRALVRPDPQPRGAARVATTS